MPYCRVACPYCDFVKKPISGDVPGEFGQALCREIAAGSKGLPAQSVFFGGGTPSLLTPDALAAIMETLRTHYDMQSPEVSLEANPDDVTLERCRAWQGAGVNRIMLGVQSFDDETLRYLGRCHDSKTARKACGIVASEFDNWGLDLIFGARPSPSLAKSLDVCIEFSPPHVSTYGLTYEERTPFWKHRAEAIEDDDSLALYRMAMDRLVEYAHYEVSNFARPGSESRHNGIYWRNEEYHGFGPGAYSYRGRIRSRNHPGVPGYLKDPGRKSETLELNAQEIRVETLIQHFRTRRGLAAAYYEARFDTPLAADFGEELDGLTRRGLLEGDGKRIWPTRKGYELNNEIGLALV
jgi:oxygen-independent coproporphyrinogen-3 oxidase